MQIRIIIEIIIFMARKRRYGYDALKMFYEEYMPNLSGPPIEEEDCWSTNSAYKIQENMYIEYESSHPSAESDAESIWKPYNI